MSCASCSYLKSKQPSKQTKTRLKELGCRHLLPSLMARVWSLEPTLWKERTDSCKSYSDNTSSNARGKVGTPLHTYEKCEPAQLLWKEFGGCSKSTHDLAIHCWIHAARVEICVLTKPCSGCWQLCYIT